jgi:predicted nucleotide-binding protein (sugar kinase/HSP70/actin superfamily)
MLFSQLSRRAIPAAPGTLAGKKIWLPRIAEGPARALAAVFRSLGVDSECTPPSDARTRELGARHTNGDECYPTKITMGDYLKVLERPGTDPGKTAFLMATGQGPCRFGQYLPYMRSVLATLGYSEVTLLSPSFENGYSDFGENSTNFVRSAWRAIVASDILRKLLLKTRPYETVPGAADAVHEECVRDLCGVLERDHRSYGAQMERLRECLSRARALFRMLPRRNGYVRPLIGIVGEIFCRLNTFSNEDLVRRLEEAGAEVWMNDLSEWIWYTNSEASRMFRRQGSRYSKTALASRIRA